ncbi:hypothetical protein PPERSA_01209 [Pseudocohnilembus persalinus]|uniref:Uncharacterized protein n=1 Tax=Pseudocohnilembus persalinus TaxID=266149 RepID=A0A0V0QBM8_PSEPJ|nr:hypothetical protein PPERSA_01209 [Pseudocohnilembus persalinus]|eukprot:KRW99600.1 hypothetical protein PPERSA_01209 [Pseudocohnilembus persalinus]
MMSSFSNFAKKKFNEKKQELDQIKEIQPRHQTQINQRQGLFSLNKVRQQQRENYIIKDNDLNEILKNEIENFYNTPHDEFYRDLISEIAQIAEITKKQEQKLLNLLKINHVALHNVLQTYNQNKDIDEIKEDLQLLFEAQATEINKQNIQRFNHFNAILRHLYDQQEFISTLKLITQISQKKFNLQYDDMESFTDGMLEQMKYVFAFRQEFNFDEQISLEKMIKSLDTQLLPIEYFKLLIEDENSVIYSAYEVYLLKSNDASLENNSFVSFPQSMWGLVESHNNLTPRGLVSPVAESCTGPGILDSFLLPQSQDQNNTNKFYQYMIYVWNGKTANPFIKSFSLSQAFELEKLIVKGGENILNILFSGGVIRSKKLQKGSIIQLNSSSNDQTINKGKVNFILNIFYLIPIQITKNIEIIKELRNMSQTVYLLKFLFHDQSNSMCNLSYNNNNGSFNSLNSNNNQLQQGQKQNTNQSFENNHNNQSISNSLQPDEFQELEEEDDKRDKFQHFRTMFLNQKNYNNNNQNNQNNNEFQYESNFIGFNPQSYKQLQQFQQTQANNGYEDQDDYYNYQNQFQFQSQQNNYIDQNYNNVNNNNDFNDFQIQQNNTEQFQDKQIPQFNLNIPNQNFNLQNDQQLQYQQNFDQQQYKQQNEFNQFGYQDEQVQYNPEYDQNQIQDGQYQNDTDKNYGQQVQAQSKNFKQDFNLNLNKLKNNFVSSEDENNINDQEQQAKQNQSNKPGFQLNLNFQNQAKNQNNQNNVNNNQNVNSQSSRNSQINSLSSNRQNPVLSLGIQHNQFQKQIQMDLEDYQSPYNYQNYDNQQQNYNQSNQQQNQDFQNLNNNTNNMHHQKKQHNLALNFNDKQNETQEIQQQQQPQGFQLNLESANNFKKNNMINKLELPQKNNTNLQYIPGKTRTDQTGTEACADPIKLQQIYADICSEVVPGKLYLSGQNVAFNKQLLQEVGITHIINCAGNVCPSKFTEEIQYKTYFLKDAKEENIESIFYETNFFMEEAFQNGGKVLVHCHKGVSRSVTLCMAYIIWKNKLTFDQAFQQVKNSRDIASPNPGFLVQLINYDKRITQGYDSILISPRVFLVCSHQLEQPELVVAKMEVAQKHINLLQQYESGGEDIITINEGEENEDFWKLWGYDKQPEEAVGENSDWDNWFLELEPDKLQPPRLYYKECISESSDDQRNQQNNNDANDSQEQNITQTIPILFIFPESRQAVKMFDMDDLQEDSLCILCKQEGNILKQFVWRGYKVEGDEFDTANLSDEFIECFDDF